MTNDTTQWRDDDDNQQYIRNVLIDHGITNIRFIKTANRCDMQIALDLTAKHVYPWQIMKAIDAMDLDTDIIESTLNHHVIFVNEGTSIEADPHDQGTEIAYELFTFIVVDYFS